MIGKVWSLINRHEKPNYQSKNILQRNKERIKKLQMERKRKTEEKKSKEMEEVKKAPKRKTLVKATITKRPSKY